MRTRTPAGTIANFVRRCAGIVLLGFAAMPGSARAAAPVSCKKVVLAGEVNAGQTWQTALGQEWVFRILPVPPGQAGYSGWDLAVDREPPAGYPDALLLATLPYNSINEREIGTTFGLRAQDAIGWNPRSFRFLSNPAEFKQAQRWFLELSQSAFAAGAEGKPGTSTKRAADTMARLLELEKGASHGEFRILDARVVPG